MFTKVIKTLVLSIILLMFQGCYGGYSPDTGLDVSEIVYLDGEYETGVSVERGAVFGLDVAEPLASGYQVSGAAFDPAMVRMERYLSYDDDGTPRVRYLFTALAVGASDVNVKMRPAAGGPEDVYRTAHVVVEKE